ncbi:MAG TPA: hypothetical protein VEQ67_19525, partial [Mycobacterium sp.]|nr:hypothetical protein [Mycobacterium sp.]
MGERGPLRRIGDPVVAAAPVGVRIRTRIHPTGTEAAALAAIGAFLGSVFRAELAGRVELGRLDRASQAVWRAQRKQALTAVASSRWAGAITRAVEDQYQLGMRALSAHVTDLRQAVDVLEQRCALRPGERDADHLACCVLDSSGNPVGDPMTIRVDTAGLPATRRDGRVR